MVHSFTHKPRLPGGPSYVAAGFEPLPRVTLLYLADKHTFGGIRLVQRVVNHSTADLYRKHKKTRESSRPQRDRGGGHSRVTPGDTLQKKTCSKVAPLGYPVALVPAQLSQAFVVFCLVRTLSIWVAI